MKKILLLTWLFMACKAEKNRAAFIRLKSGTGESWGQGFTHSKRIDDSTYILWRHVESPGANYYDTVWIDFWQRPETSTKQTHQHE